MNQSHSSHTIEPRELDVKEPPQPLALSVREFCSLAGISRSNAYLLIKKGEIPSLRLGERILIPKKAAIDFLERGVKWEQSAE